MFRAMTIAGSDSGGGAGIQADLKTFQRFGVYGTSALTLITAQNTLGVQAVHLLPVDVVTQQIASVLDDLGTDAVKTGAIGSSELITAVAHELRVRKLTPVVDPVMISKHGAPLLPADAVVALRAQLFPLAEVVTPNLHEAEALLGEKIRTVDAMETAASRLRALGPACVILKGGALGGDEALDVLCDAHGTLRLTSPRVDTRATHGTGCTFSAAITALRARGADLREAAREAKQFVTRAMSSAPGLGGGVGPVNHLA